MKKLSINAMSDYLSKLIDHNIQSSLMLWGPPGIGKSAIVANVAKKNKIDLIDLRISQLAPTDLRGLPVPEDNKAKWYVPEFLPTKGKGILFLDEINMAPPAIQGIAQQLILDRRVGSYQVPDGWFIWGAGNRKEDFAAVFDMPSPLANRFIHLEATSNLKDFKKYAIGNKFDDQIISFLNFRPALLHKVNKDSQAWPSPRSWEIANKLLSAGLSIDPAVGDSTAAEFRSFIKIYKNLPAIEPILNGDFKAKFPEDLSAKYALTCALALRANSVQQVENAFLYLDKKGELEWLTQCAYDVSTAWTGKKDFNKLLDMIIDNPKLIKVAESISKLMAA